MTMEPTLVELLGQSPQTTFAVDIAVKATLILGATAAAALLLLRRSSAAARHITWCVGLGAVLALPPLCLALPGLSWRVLPTAAPALRRARPAVVGTAAVLSETSGVAPLPAGSVAFDADELLLSGVTHPAFAPAPDDSTLRAVRPWGLVTPSSWWWLLVAWLAGFVAVLSASLAGRISPRRLARGAQPLASDEWTALSLELSARLGLRRRVLLLRGDRATMPMTWGWLRPLIMLPAGTDSWSFDRRHDVLLHELAHVKRLDCLTQALARLACAVYWFHPLVWFAARRTRIERERACDDVVLLAGAKASDYAGHLLKFLVMRHKGWLRGVRSGNR